MPPRHEQFGAYSRRAVTRHRAEEGAHQTQRLLDECRAAGGEVGGVQHQVLRPLLGLASVDPVAHFKAMVSRRPEAWVEEGYRVSGGILLQAARYADQNRFPLLVVLIPDEMQVYPAPFLEQIRAHGLDPGDYDLDLPARKWSEIIRTAGLPVLDLLPVFRAHDQGPHLYMKLEGHLSVTGNRVTAEAIQDAVGALLTRREPRS